MRPRSKATRAANPQAQQTQKEQVRIVEPAVFLPEGDARRKQQDCGHNAGCRTIFVDRNYWALRQPPGWPVKSFGEAVEVIILKRTRRRLAKSDLRSRFKHR
jgi:hypothetical protein